MTFLRALYEVLPSSLALGYDICDSNLMTSQQSSIVVLLIIVVVIGVLVALMPRSIQSRATELQCKFRLGRLGIATNEFIFDSGRTRFPPIRNPQQGAIWMPDTPQSTDQVLAMYLQGDIKSKQRENESIEDYIIRQRRASFAVDPASELPFWYNDVLQRDDPRRFLTNGEQRRWYFACQRLGDGSWPYEQDGESGIFAVDGLVVVTQVSREEIDQFESIVTERRAEDPSDPETIQLHQELQRYREAQQASGGATITLYDLEHDVRFEAR